MFCSIDLAARIERAERDLVASCAEGLRARLPDCYCAEISGGFVCQSEPGSPMNKVAGLGFAPFDQSAFELVEHEHARRKAALQVEVSSLGDAAIGQWLTGRGYELVGVENVLGRPLRNLPAPVRPPPPDLVIDVIGAGDFDGWLDVLVTGFCTSDLQGVPAHEAIDRVVVERTVRDLEVVTGFVRYLARRAGVPAGAAAARMSDGIALLCGSATLPVHRRRGVQSAMLAHRLDDAARAGNELAVVTTQPGSKSQQNAQQIGFALLYSRNVLRREAW